MHLDVLALNAEVMHSIIRFILLFMCECVPARGVRYKRYRKYTGMNLRYGMDFDDTV